jgi:hypothetical protein
MVNRHRFGAEMRRLAEQMAREYNGKLPIGELVSQKYVPESVGVKLTDFAPKRKTWKQPEYIGGVTESKALEQYNFYCTVLWLHHPDLETGGVQKYHDVYFDLIKKADEKKVLERLK